MRLACCFLGALGAVQYFCAHGRPRAAPGCRMATFLRNNSPGAVFTGLIKQLDDFHAL